jgi:hypothetical protein
MLTLLFRHEPKSAHTDARVEFNNAICSWGKLKKGEKLADIFRGCAVISPLIISQHNTVFEIRLTGADDTLIPSAISGEDLVIALGFDPSEWTVWKGM